MAMDARCYNGGEGKTRLHPLVYKKQDYAAYGIMLLYVAIMIFCSFILISGSKSQKADAGLPERELLIPTSYISYIKDVRIISAAY